MKGQFSASTPTQHSPRRTPAPKDFMKERFSELTPHEVKRLLVAKYISEGHPQHKIVKLLRGTEYQIAAPACANLKREAEEEGLLKPWVWLNPDSYSEEIWNQIRLITSGNMKLEPTLKELSRGQNGPVLKNLRIYYSGQAWTSLRAWDDRLESFSMQASRRVLGLLEKADKVGIGWGHTVTSCVSTLERFSDDIAKHPKIHTIGFIPTCGEPLGPERRLDRTSSALVARLNALWGCDSRPYSLAGVAVVIPEQFKGAERDVVRRYIAELSDYKAIFGSPVKTDTVRLVGEIDTLLTSVGVLSKDGEAEVPTQERTINIPRANAAYRSELERVGGIREEKLHELVFGDIDGALIPQSGLTDSQEKDFRFIAESWTGITLKQCERIASKAVKADKPGIIVLAIGANKADIVLEVVKHKLVNELIIDHDLANAISQKLASRAKQG